MLLCVLAVMGLFFCSASASAAFTLPKGITDIGDEAFRDANVSYYLTIPEGVKTIGHLAFAGSSAAQVRLPASVIYIAPDAFEANAAFVVLPGSYAGQWCRDNGYFCENMRISVDRTSVCVYDGHPMVLNANCPYPDQVDFYRWETSTDLKNWEVVEGVQESSVQVEYVSGLSKSYLRCRASVKGVLLDYANYATISYKPGSMQFDTQKSKAVSGDAIYLEWTDMGSNIEYYLSRWEPDASLEEGGSWKEIASRLTDNAYTVYGLEKNTEYSFVVVALQATDDGRDLRFETDSISIETLVEPSSFQITECRADGTRLYIEWERVDGAFYRVEYLVEGSDPALMSEKWSDASMWLNGMPKNTECTIRVTAWVSDKNGKLDIASATANATSGDYDPTIRMNDITVSNGIAHVSWTSLPDINYELFISTDGGETSRLIAYGLSEPYYDVTGLEAGEQYYFSASSDVGDWSTSTDWVPVTIPGKTAGGTEYRALLIGEVTFKGSQYAARNYGDVELLANALAATKTPDGSYYSVVRRKDQDKGDILAAIRETFRDADENDVSLFFIATHGDVNDLGRDAGCLATVDRSGRQGFLDLYMLAEELSMVEGKVIVWLGSCGSGAGIYEEGVPQNGDALSVAAMQAFSEYDDNVSAMTGEFRREGKFYVLTAARYHELSWGQESRLNNYFVRFMTEGLTLKDGAMKADADGNGSVTQHEMFLYIKDREEDDSDYIFQNVQEYPLNSDYVLFKQ